MWMPVLVCSFLIGGSMLICLIPCVRDLMRARRPFPFNVERVPGRVADAILDGLQDFVYHSQRLEHLPFSHKDCTICLDDLEEGHRLLIIPSCHHVFHADCIRQYMLHQATCPVCRRRISLEDAAATDENATDSVV